MGQQVQRLAAYAVVVRDDRILLTRLAERVTKHELWTLPGGGVDHGEDPRAAVVREIYEETGLHAAIGETAHVFSMHLSRHLAARSARGRALRAHRVRRLGRLGRARPARRGDRRVDRWMPPGSRSPTCSTGRCRRSGW